MQLPRIRDLAPDIKQELIRINKRKKQWFRDQNTKSLVNDGKELFKTSFHDYAHVVPKFPLGLSNDDEVIARYLEDHVLQKLPGTIPKRIDIDGTYNQTIKDSTSGITGKAYDSLYELGKYSTAKKKGIPIENVTGAQVMLNKFKSNTKYVYFANPINKALKNKWVASLANPETKYISKRVQEGRSNLYNSLMNRGNELTDNYHTMASNMLKQKDRERYILGPTSEDQLKILQKHAPYDDVTHIKVQPDEYDRSMGQVESYPSGQYAGFPRSANSFMEQPIPDDMVSDIVRRNNAEAFAIDKMHRNPYGTSTPYEVQSRRRRINANIPGAHIRPDELPPQYRL